MFHFVPIWFGNIPKITKVFITKRDIVMDAKIFLVLPSLEAAEICGNRIGM